MKKLFCVLLLFVFLAPAYGQDKAIDGKYFSALLYLKTNKQINDDIHSNFRRLAGKKKITFVEFNVSNKVEFLDLAPFKERIAISKKGIPFDHLDNFDSYRKDYYFVPFYTQLNKVIKPNESKLHITFSKPMDNYLVLEIRTANPKFSINSKSNVKMRILLTFDENNIVTGYFQSPSGKRR